MVSEQEEITPAMLEEFDRLGEVVDQHDILCQCEEYCARFMEMGDQIRAKQMAKRAAG
jgi:hypothetical protein